MYMYTRRNFPALYDTHGTMLFNLCNPFSFCILTRPLLIYDVNSDCCIFFNSSLRKAAKCRNLWQGYVTFIYSVVSNYTAVTDPGGRSLTLIAGSNPAGGMVVCHFCVLCAASERSLRLADHSSRGVLRRCCV